jgi:hypothetical protein
VPVVERLALLLADHRVLTDHRDGLLFPGRDPGRPQSVSALVECIARRWRGAGLTPLGFHDARHTAASLFIAAGLNAKTVSTYLGHASEVEVGLLERIAGAGQDLIDRAAADAGAEQFLPQFDAIPARDAVSDRKRRDRGRQPRPERALADPGGQLPGLLAPALGAADAHAHARSPRRPAGATPRPDGEPELWPRPARPRLPASFGSAGLRPAVQKDHPAEELRRPSQGPDPGIAARLADRRSRPRRRARPRARLLPRPRPTVVLQRAYWIRRSGFGTSTDSSRSGSTSAVTPSRR